LEGQHLATLQTDGKANRVERLETIAAYRIANARASSSVSGLTCGRSTCDTSTNVATLRATNPHLSA
jgi:hypothetical protein